MLLRLKEETGGGQKQDGSGIPVSFSADCRTPASVDLFLELSFLGGGVCLGVLWY